MDLGLGADPVLKALQQGHHIRIPSCFSLWGRGICGDYLDSSAQKPQSPAHQG